MEKTVIVDSFKKGKIEVKKYKINIPDGINHIKVTLDSDFFEHFFLIVKDPKGVLRAGLTYKTRIKEYVISSREEYSSCCTDFGKIEGGVWTFTVIKPYEIGGGFSFSVEEIKNPEKNEYRRIEFDPGRVFNDEKGWYKGDLHIHSTHSDGRQSLKDIDRKSQEKGLNFMALTDHSILSTHFYPEKGRIIIPATEVTFDDDGHLNIFGLTEVIDYTKFFEESSYQSKDEIIDRVIKHYKSEGKIVSMNHFCHPIIPFKHNIDFENIDFLEILNSPYEARLLDHNLDALKFFDFLWNKNFLIYGIGGSDSHKTLVTGEDTLGDPLNYIYTDNLSYNSLFNGLKKGNSYVARDGEVEFLILCGGKPILPGEKVKGQIQWSVQYKKDLIWTLIKNGEAVSEKKGLKADFLFELGENDFCRIQGYNERKERVEVFLNPIHFKENRRSSVRWHDLIDEYREIKK